VTWHEDLCAGSRGVGVGRVERSNFESTSCGGCDYCVFAGFVSLIKSGQAVKNCGWVVGGLCVVAMWLLLFGGTLTPRVAGRLLIIICCGFFVVLCELESYF